MTVKEEHSIAAIVYSNNEYLLLKYGLGHWEFVKGHKEANETDEETILRELKEETSITDAEIIKGFKEKYEYNFTFRNQKIHKLVSCYLIKSNTKKVKLSYEHDDFKWLPFHKAIKQLTFNNSKKLLKKAETFRTSSLSSFI
ncbi:MAG: bis(5'-nucleosyl)-tetraphosphatase [Candidatus Hodarchaeota archaeon]